MNTEKTFFIAGIDLSKNIIPTSITAGGYGIPAVLMDMWGWDMWASPYIWGTVVIQ